jgi:cytochrome c oxidase subunit 2
MTRPARWRRRGTALAGLVAAVVVLTGCGHALLPGSVTDQSAKTPALWKTFVAIAVVILVLVYGLILWTVLKYRRRRRDDGSAPSQKQYIVPLEIMYTAIPLVIVAVLWGLSVAVEHRLTATTDRPDLKVDVVGFQWQWQFNYEGTPVVVTGVPGDRPTLVLPVGRTVQLHLRTQDVIHSFWVPQFLDKRDLTPGVDNKVDVKITRAGRWDGVCSEFCGLDHWKMSFQVEAVDGATFDAWIAKGGGPPP